MTSLRLSEPIRALVILALVALLTRAWIIGDPVVNIDEQFYLMVGDRVRHGALPYLDIWDRKPIGLFLIYASACRFFANPVIGYQVMAMLSVIVTSQILFGMARRITSFGPAVAGAAAYPAWLLVFGGVGGQSPVFYNLPMALAAAWTLRLMQRTSTRHFTAQGCAIMLLAGLAMQIKYTALFEGVFFGLSLLWREWDRRHAPFLLIGKGIAWVLSALLPTMAALGTYLAMGHGAAFIQANFQSVLGDTNFFLEAFIRLASLTFGVFPLLICAGIVWRRHRRADAWPADERGAVTWLLGWAAASYVGILFYGVWYDHYFLPLLAPLSVLAGLAFGSVVQARRWIAFVVGLGLAGGIGRAVVDVGINGNARQLAQMTELVEPGLSKGCIYVNEDIAALYQVTGSCLPTRFVFPQHLMLGVYRRGLGTDQLGELRRVLANRPGVIVSSREPDLYTRDDARALLLDTLRRNYRLVGTTVVGETGYAVYHLKD